MANDDKSPLTGDLDELTALFRRAEKPADRFAVGTEWERAGLLADTLEPIRYEGPRGVRAVLERLQARHGYAPLTESAGGPLLGLERGRENITLEPAAQIELSGAPLRTAHETAAEVARHLAEVDEVSAELGIVWLGLGFHPFATHDDLPWVPKSRYGVMRTYLPTRSPTGLDMMRRTQTVQANLDYPDESTAMAMLVASIKLQPVITAMFANSPWVEGRATGERSRRASVWVQMDPDRSGLLPAAFHEAPSYRTYVEWALDVPMFIVKRTDRVREATHLTFRQFLRDGLDGERATASDWETHVNTLFPEVRLKRTLEMRGLDAQDRTLIPAVPALFKGLLYDETSRAKAVALAESLPLDAVIAARPDIAQDALRATIGGRSVASLAGDVLDLARAGLERLGDPTEAQYLEPLAALVQAGRCPADARLEAAAAAGGDRAAIVSVSRA